MDKMWSMFLLWTLVPLALGVGSLCVMPRIRNVWVQIPAFFLGVCSLLFFATQLITAGPYVWAVNLEEKWTEAKPKSREELESHLSLYTETVSESGFPGWGMNHEYEPGDYMVRYNILWNAPLDVVYTSDDLLVATYTTYE